MSKILILPDIHLRHEIAEKIIQSTQPDQIIFLGDYFDDFDDTSEMVINTSHWLSYSIKQKNRIHICGNHDHQYWFKDNKNIRCSGYEQYKSIIINDIITKKDWEKLHFFYIMDNTWLLSHGGIHPGWLFQSKFKMNEIYEYSLKNLERKLINDSKAALIKFNKNDMHWFAMPGFSRCYESRFYGGLMWNDWNDEFMPIRGIHQIAGHTPNHELTWKIIEEEGGTTSKTLPLDGVINPTLTDKNSYNICLDSRPGSKYYAIYENKQLIIHKYNDIKE